MNGIDLSTAGLIGLLISFVLPVIVGLATKYETNSTVQSFLLVALSTLTSGLVTLEQSLTDHVSGFSFSHWAILLVITYVEAMATYTGLWKPTGVISAAQAIGSKTAVPAIEDLSYAGPDPQRFNGTPTAGV